MFKQIESEQMFIEKIIKNNFKQTKTFLDLMNDKHRHRKTEERNQRTHTENDLAGSTNRPTDRTIDQQTAKCRFFVLSSQGKDQPDKVTRD